MKKKITIVVALAMVVAMLCLVLTACVPSIDKVEDNLEAKGYIVEDEENDKPDEDGVVANLYAYKGSIGTSGLEGEMITVTWFDSTKSAKAAMDKLSEADRKELEEEGYIIKRDGKVIISGTKQAIEDMKQYPTTNNEKLKKSVDAGFFVFYRNDERGYVK